MPLPTVAAGSRARRLLLGGGGLSLGALFVVAFYDAGRLHGGYDLRAFGNSLVPLAEVAFFAWYFLFGSLAALAFSFGLFHLGAGDALLELAARAMEQPRRWVLAVALCAFAASLAFARVVLKGQPLTDDESTFLFIAQTLLEGRLANPAPADAAFFSNQFIIVTATQWYGKYPIGHPLLLAVGEAVGLREVVMPAVGAASLFLTWLVGRRLVGERAALVGATFLLLSPHFVWTHGTQLSQPTGTLALLLGCWAMLRLEEDRRLRWAALAGAAFGFGVLVRPLPGGLFLPVALVSFALSARAEGRPLGERAKELAVAAVFVALGAGALGWVNFSQSGSPWTSGYQTFHAARGLHLFENDKGQIASSVGGALLRENFWLFGWTVSLFLVPLGRPTRHAVLFFGVFAAELAYRVIAPKTVVASTGPIYVTEAVPFLALATADGLLRGKRWLEQAVGAPLGPRVLAGLAGAWLAALAMFVPPTLGSVQRGVEAREAVFNELERVGAERALVFSDVLVHPQSGLTWAFWPPNPSPRLDDEVLFLRKPPGPEGAKAAQELWKRRFPERRAFVLDVDPEATRLREL